MLVYHTYVPIEFLNNRLVVYSFLEVFYACVWDFSRLFCESEDFFLVGFSEDCSKGRENDDIKPKMKTTRNPEERSEPKGNVNPKESLRLTEKRGGE